MTAVAVSNPPTKNTRNVRSIAGPFMRPSLR
jgi:hypothetical protein